MPAAIQVHDLRKIYPTKSGQEIKALDGVSFEIEAGQIYGLLGPNGAGKSTLVKCLSTLTPPTSGRAAVLGFDVVHQSMEVRRRMAVVLQQTAAETLLTVRDNLLIYAYLHGIGTREAERRMNEVVEEFELGERLQNTVQELSLGTKRRIQVAKIFMLDVPVIMLDEATTGMDPMMKRRTLDRLRAEARKGRTILLTTQVLSEAEELCDTIMIIDHGRTMAAGTLQELRKHSMDLFRVRLAFKSVDAALRARIQALAPKELHVDGNTVEMVFQGDEASLLAKLADISRVTPILEFEVRGPTLEEIFMTFLEKAA